MRKIVVMPGGFHPFHAGHASLYQSAMKAFPDADVYVAATNDTKTRPFPFSIKEKLAKVAGVKQGRFVQVKSPFKAEEITSHYNPSEDVLIFVRSEKDKNEQPKPGGTKKDGTPSYFQPWTGKNLQPFSKHAYMAYLPTVEFGPGITSATEIRNAWPTLNDKRKTAMVMSLYPATQKNPKLADNVVKMLDMGMSGELTEEFRPSSSQAMNIRRQTSQKMNPGANKLVWKRPNQIGGSYTENELKSMNFKYSSKYNMWGGTQQMWDRLSSDSQGLAEAEKTAKVFHPQYVDVYFLDGPRREPILVNRKVPYNLIDRYLELVTKKYNLQQGRFEFRNSEEENVAEGLGIPYPTTYEQENNKFKRTGAMRITDLTEFAPPSGDDREPDEEILRKLAAQWWNGTEQQMKKAQQTLAAMGWDIGQDESGDEDAGVFVIRIGDTNGDSYIAFPHSDLGLNEDYLNEK
jgi:glycerol-3-phosphate cytidylyltransferase-like family protein